MILTRFPRYIGFADDFNTFLEVNCFENPMQNLNGVTDFSQENSKNDRTC